MDDKIGDVLRYILLSMVFGTTLMASGLAWLSSWQSGCLALPIGVGSFVALRVFLRSLKTAMIKWSRELR